MLIPPHPGVGAASGLLSAQLRYEFKATLWGDLDDLDYAAVSGQFDKMTREATERLAGDRLEITLVSGGGYGDPLQRDPRRVADNALDGLLTSEEAREQDGVAIDPESGAPDKTATNTLRREHSGREGTQPRREGNQHGRDGNQTGRESALPSAKEGRPRSQGFHPNESTPGGGTASTASPPSGEGGNAVVAARKRS